MKHSNKYLRIFPVLLLAAFAGLMKVRAQETPAVATPVPSRAESTANGRASIATDPDAHPAVGTRSYPLLADADQLDHFMDTPHPGMPAYTFGEYLGEVSRSNLDFIIERFNIDIAEAEVIAAKTLPDPELSFEAADETYVVELGYTVELGGKRQARVQLARSTAEFEKLAVAYFFQELRAEAADVFLEAILQREILEFKESSYEYMLQLSRSDSIRYLYGEITENDARQSRLEAASLLNDVYDQEAQYKSALVTLNQFMGRTADTLTFPLGNLPAPDREYNLTQLIDYALENRVDIAAAGKNAEIAMKELRLVRAERRLDVDLFVGYERDWRGPWPTRNTLRGGVAIPIKFSNLNKGQVRAARYAVDRSKFEVDNAALQVQAQVAQAYYAFEAMQKQVAQYQSGMLEDNRKLLDGIVYTYQRGETDILEVLIAQRTYNEIQEQYLETLKGYAAAMIELERTAGLWNINF